MYRIVNDLIGKEYGNLIVINVVKVGKLYKALCRCTLCGAEKLCNKGNLVKSKNGCKCTPRKRKMVINDITNQTFGRLYVVEMRQKSSEHTGHYYAVCRCECGKDNHWVRPSFLKDGTTKSCGCDKTGYKKITGQNNVQFTGYGNLSGKYFGAIKRRARTDGYEIDFTAEWLWNLFLEQNKKCALSGLDIEIEISVNKYGFGSASVDRIDSNKGYVCGNVQWVHKDINKMKSDLELDRFIQLCKFVSTYKG